MRNNTLTLNFLLSIVFFLLSINLSFSQERQTIKGLVVVDFKKEIAENVFITNLNTNITSETDISGRFTIKAEEGDTLLLQSSFLKTRKFYVKESSFRFNPLIIHMNFEIIELDELIIRKPLTGNLREDIKQVKINQDVEKIYANLGIDIRILDMEPKEKKESLLPKVFGIPIPVSLNIDALYKTFTGYYRKMENLNSFKDFDKKLKYIQSYLGDDFFVNQLEIPKEDIYGFLLYVSHYSKDEFDTYYLNKNYLNMRYLLNNRSKEFIKRLKERDKSN